MAEYLLGVDNGSTVSKAAIFDLEGREVRVASRKIEPNYPHRGWTERSMHLLWQRTAEAIREAITDSGIDPKQIIGVGTTGHGNGLYLLDKQGNPARPGIQSMDTRAAAIIDEWNSRDLHSQIFPCTFQAFWPAQPNALLAWIKRNEPEIYQRIGAVLLCKDYINYCLTREIATDFSDMSATSLMDVRNRRYSQELLESFGIGEVFAALPTPVHRFEVI
jgi:L-xylulokinase